MKAIIAIALLMLYCDCFAQEHHFEDDQNLVEYLNFKPGRSYTIFSYPDNQPDSALLFEIIPPQFKRVTKTILTDKNDSGTLRVKVADEFFEIKKTKPCGSAYDTLPHLTFSLLPEDAKYKTFKTQNLDKVIYTYDSLVADAKLYSSYIGQLPISIRSNQFILAKGYHSEFREIICCGSKVKRKLVQQIQEKLVAAGYDLDIDNVLAESTRDAIIDYQKKHGLPVGNMNVETLKHLGVPGY